MKLKTLEEFNAQLEALTQKEARIKTVIRMVKVALIAELSPVQIGEIVQCAHGLHQDACMRVEKLEVIQQHKGTLVVGILASGRILAEGGQPSKSYGRVTYSLQAGVTRHVLK